MDKIVVLDFGGQYSHLISRRIRDLGVYAEILPAETTVHELKNMADDNNNMPKGIILSGGAASVYDQNAPSCDPAILNTGIPLLGICYGFQLIAKLEAGKVVLGDAGEYGITKFYKHPNINSLLLSGLNDIEKVWMNHRDKVESLPPTYNITGYTAYSPIASFENPAKKIFGVQFHPEVTHTQCGTQILANFVFKICNCKRSWLPKNIIDEIITEAQAVIGDNKAIIGLSGGIDSSTATALVSKAIGTNLIAVYVNTGLMQHDETELITKTFSNYEVDLRIVDASQRFFQALKGVTDPEAKRKIIGQLFIEIFDEIARAENVKILVQGTIYSDRIESGSTKYSARIKSHHNVGGLPPDIKLKIYEPLRNLYKDEVRRIATAIGLPAELITKHVFPGPGLAVRIIGEVTPERADIVRRASNIIEEELKRAGWYDKVWMAFAVLLPIRSVGIQGDTRTYKYPIVIRIVESRDAMTANFVKLPYELLERISTRITNEIDAINRVVYDLSNKPPATMEWE